MAWAPVVAGLWTTGGGKSRHAEVFRRGGNVALGTDGTITGIPIDLTNAARQAVVLSREDGLGVNALAAEDTFEMMTIGGARALGLADELGSIEPGKRADIVIRSNELWDLVPHGHLVAQLIFAARSRGVDTVFVDGRMVFRKGAFHHLDEKELRASANEVVSNLMRRMDWNIRSPWPIVTQQNIGSQHQ
jgi:5-methylthioadenosine/S-adenosylhomocysteine deaminase